MVAKVNQRIHQVTVASRFARAEDAAADLRQHLVQLFILLVVVARAVALTTQRFHLFGGVTEDKEVICPDVLLHLNVGPVQRTNRQRPVERELHVTGAGCLGARERDLLGEIRRRDDHLRQAHAVVRDKDHLQLVANLRIVVDHIRHIVDQVNDVLRHVVGGSRFPGEDVHTRYPLRIRVGLDAVVAGDHVQHVHQLAFVLVNTLNLHVEQRVRVHHHVQVLGDKDCEALFVLKLGVMHRLIHLRIVNMLF